MKKNVLLLAVTMLLMSWYLGAQTFPKISEPGNETWYSIYSYRSSKVIQNAGNDLKAESANLVAENDNLKWKFQLVSRAVNVGEPDTFKIVSKADMGEFVHVAYKEVTPGTGGYIWYEGDYLEAPEKNGTHNLVDRFFTSATGGTRFVFRQFGDDTSGFKFQIYSVDHESYVNMTNTSMGSDYTLYGYNNDGGNPFSAINDLMELYKDLPTFSTAANPVWYQIKNLRRGTMFATEGMDQTVVLKAAVVGNGAGRDEQLFRLEGTVLSHKIVCKAGGELKYDGTLNIACATEGDLFGIIVSANTTYGADKFEIKHLVRGTCINGAPSNKLELYSGGDNGAVVSFIPDDYDPFEKAPKMSTESAPVWYQIKNTRAGGFLYDNAEASLIFQGTAEEVNLQLFRFQGTYNGFSIVAYNGREMKSLEHEGQTRFELGAAGTGNTFNFIEKEEGKWGIQYNGTQDGLNANGNIVTTYSLGDAGSVWEFIEGSGTGIVPVNMTDKVQLFLSDNNLVVKAENMTRVRIFDVRGSRLADFAASNSFEYPVTSSGLYIVSVQFTDGTVENIKFVVK